MKTIVGSSRVPCLWGLLLWLAMPAPSVTHAAEAGEVRVAAKRVAQENLRPDAERREYAKCAFCDKPAVSTKPGAVPCCTEHYYKPQKMESGERERRRCEVCGRPGDWLQQWGDVLCDQHYRERDTRGETAEAFGRRNLTCAWCGRPAMCFKPASGKPACDIHYMLRESVDGTQAGIKCSLCGKPAATIGQDRTGWCKACSDRMVALNDGGRGGAAAADRPVEAQVADAPGRWVNVGSGLVETLAGVRGAIDVGAQLTADATPAADAAAPRVRPVLGPGNLPPGVNGGHFPPPGRPGVATLRTADGQTVDVPVDAEGRILGPVQIPQAGGAPPISWPPGWVAPDMANSLLGMEAAAPTGGRDALATMSDPGTASLAALNRGLEEQANDRSTALVEGGKQAWDERTMVENSRNIIRESELRAERIKQDARAELQNTLTANARSRQTNTLAATLGNSVLDGVTTGVKNLGDTFGKHAADHVVDKLKLDKEEKPAPAASDGTSSTGESPGGWATSTPVGGRGGKGAENGPDGHGGMAPAHGGGPVVTVEGYDMTCNKCGFKMRIVEGQPVPAACPQCGASGGNPPPTAGDGMFDAICTKCGTRYGGPISQMNKGCPKCGTGGGGVHAPDGVFDAFCPICKKKYGG
ncbi:MAG: hypothetical protein KJ579_06235, partial [Verrucomicrobia bacterium]|nr:hypothetical protein [Verrucomicrobiota bacterium]